jgi:hypothetical protein
MIFSTAQQNIIREICSMEFTTLEDLIQIPSLGNLNEEFSYESILAMHGCTRSDFDEELIDTYHKFQILHDNPDTLFELGKYDIWIFIQILHLMEDEFKDKYPNALINLWNKIFIWESTNEIKN